MNNALVPRTSSEVLLIVDRRIENPPVPAACATGRREVVDPIEVEDEVARESSEDVDRLQTASTRDSPDTVLD